MALRVLSSGVDTLNLSARGAVRADVWEALEAAKRRAAAEEESAPFAFATGRAFLVRPYGLRGYTYWLSSPDCELLFGRSERFRPLWFNSTRRACTRWAWKGPSTWSKGCCGQRCSPARRSSSSRAWTCMRTRPAGTWCLPTWTASEPVRASFYEVLGAAKVPKVRLYALRHTMASSSCTRRRISSSSPHGWGTRASCSS